MSGIFSKFNIFVVVETVSIWLLLIG